MASIKIKGTLESADLLGFPLTMTLDQSYAGVGKIKSFQKFTTTVIKAPVNPSLLPGTAFSSTDKKVYIYLKNTSITATEHINIYVKVKKVAIFYPHFSDIYPRTKDTFLR